MAVTHMREIEYRDMSEYERSRLGIWRLDDLCRQQSTTRFDDPNGYFALYENIDLSEGCDTECRRYAVYLKPEGSLLCLLPDAGTALDGYADTAYGEERSRLYKEIAKAAGWPEKLPRCMTWRDIRNQLIELSDAELDMEALVWTPQDFNRTCELTPIVRLDPSSDPDCAVNESNPLSFTLAE